MRVNGSINRSKFFFLLMLLLLSAVVARAKSFRFADYGNAKGTRSEALAWFDKELRQRSDNRMGLQFFWGGSLLKGKVTLKGVSDGVAEMGTVVMIFTPGQLPLYEIGDLPFENPDAWVGLRAIHDLVTTTPEVREQFTRRNLVYITNYTTGPVQIASKKPVTDLDGLKGLKLRATGPYKEIFNELGAAVLSFSQAEVYQNLNSGVIDATQNYYYIIKARRQYEVAPYITELNYGQNLSFAMVMNLSAWKKLDKRDQGILSKLGRDFTDHLGRAMLDSLVQDRQAMVDGIEGKKVTIVKPSKVFKSRVEREGKKTISHWEQEMNKMGLPGSRVLGRYNGLIRKYQKVRDSGGYPWQR